MTGKMSSAMSTGSLEQIGGRFSMAKRKLACPVCGSMLTLRYKGGELSITDFRKNKEVTIHGRKPEKG